MNHHQEGATMSISPRQELHAVAAQISEAELELRELNHTHYWTAGRAHELVENLGRLRHRRRQLLRQFDAMAVSA